MSQSALGMVMFSGIKFQKELPAGSKDDEGKGPAADNMSLLQSRQKAADYGSLLGAKKKKIMNAFLKALGSDQGLGDFLSHL